MSKRTNRPGEVSGVLLSNVCVVYSPSGTEFLSVPEGVDGPSFCKLMVDRRAHPFIPIPPAEKRRRSSRWQRAIQFGLRTVTSVFFRRKVISK